MLYLHAIYLCRCASNNYTCSNFVQYYSTKGVPDAHMLEDGFAAMVDFAANFTIHATKIGFQN